MNTKDIEEIGNEIRMAIVNDHGYFSKETDETITRALTTLTQHHAAEVERAVEEERERIRTIIGERFDFSNFKKGTTGYERRAGADWLRNKILDAITPINPYKTAKNEELD